MYSDGLHLFADSLNAPLHGGCSSLPYACCHGLWCVCMHVLNTASGGRPLALGAGAAVAVVSAVALVTCSTAEQSEECRSDTFIIELHSRTRSGRLLYQKHSRHRSGHSRQGMAFCTDSRHLQSHRRCRYHYSWVPRCADGNR